MSRTFNIITGGNNPLIIEMDTVNQTGNRVIDITGFNYTSFTGDYIHSELSTGNVEYCGTNLSTVIKIN